MNAPSPLAEQALEHSRRGDFDQALAVAKRALAEQPADFGLTLFVGLLHARRMELDDAEAQFRAAAALSPADPVPRLELARLLIGLNRLDEAEELLRSTPLQGLQPKRLAALIHLRRTQHAPAAKLFEEIVGADPRDFESWGNLGICRFGMGDPQGAVDALARAISLRPDQPRFHEKWAEAQIAAGTGEEGLRSALAQASARPADPLIRVTAARLQDLLGRPEQALQSLEDALRIGPACVPALLALAKLHERQNRIDEFADLVERIGATGEPIAELPLLQARLAFRRGEFERALQLAADAPATVDPGSRALLVGQIHDRLGNAAQAFAAFSEMNRDTGLAPDIVAERAQSYRERIDRHTRLLTAQWLRDWRPAAVNDEIRDPVFLVGFPRSGTTLLDTFLMGHPELIITEERPMLDTVLRRLGGYERIAELDDDGIAELRQLYFREADVYAPDRGERLLVDKQPFAMNEAALIHRLFPNARLLFVERHPCDAVLSNFITRFEPNPALANFVTLEAAARLYDQMMTLWTKSRDLLPLRVHEVRYERLVAGAESEMQALIQFLGLDWNAALLDNRATAQERGFINTPSYSQVVEPLYKRAAGRWERYREQMEPVLPILTPWAQRMGYEV
ncbi:MAG: sulfotransferase [Sphingomicrobium sp.]